MKPKNIILLVFLGSSFLVYAQDNFVYDSKGKRDPFLPLVSKEGYLINREADVLATDMNLEGIIYDKSGKLAIINGQILKTGDTLGNYVLMDIENKRVILLRDNEKFVLELKQEE